MMLLGNCPPPRSNYHNILLNISYVLISVQDRCPMISNKSHAKTPMTMAGSSSKEGDLSQSKHIPSNQTLFSPLSQIINHSRWGILSQLCVNPETIAGIISKTVVRATLSFKCRHPLWKGITAVANLHNPCHACHPRCRVPHSMIETPKRIYFHQPVVPTSTIHLPHTEHPLMLDLQAPPTTPASQWRRWIRPLPMRTAIPTSIHHPPFTVAISI